MRTISGLITHVKPLDCPAGKSRANCINCNYHVGRVTVSREKGPTVDCCWEECMRRKEEKDDE